MLLHTQRHFSTQNTLHRPANPPPSTRPSNHPSLSTCPRATPKRPDWATSPDDAQPSQPINSVFVTRPNLTTDDLTSPFARAGGLSGGNSGEDWRADLRQLSNAISAVDDEEMDPPSMTTTTTTTESDTEDDWFPRERAYLVGVASKGPGAKRSTGYSIQESLEELERLAVTAGLEVVGSTYQHLETPSPRTYIGTGKLNEIAASVARTDAETVIFDDELTPGQLRNLSKVLGESVRLCDRTALILDIFSQRAATREGQLQVALAQAEYQLPRLTRLWTHLERQSGSGQVKGMGEKQIEVDKRLLRSRMAAIRQDLDSVRLHRQQYRKRRAEAPIPVVALVGYTNAGKSTLLNQITNAGVCWEVLAEDKLFATLDPTTRRTDLPSGKQVLFTDTVGFIQKLPTQLVAAFRATLEEIADASLLLHVVDVSHGNAAAQTEAVHAVLEELGVDDIPCIYVWNKVDNCKDPSFVSAVAAARPATVCCSGLTGQGVPELLQSISDALQAQMMAVEALVPYKCGELVDEIHRVGIVKEESFTDNGTLVTAFVPEYLAHKLTPMLVGGGNGSARPSPSSAPGGNGVVGMGGLGGTGSGGHGAATRGSGVDKQQVWHDDEEEGFVVDT